MLAARSPPRGYAGKLVNLDKLLKQLRRDATANPKKAALLGLMALVALYFWAPLLVKFASRRGAESAQAEPTSVTPNPTALPINSTLPNSTLPSNSTAIAPVTPIRRTTKFQWEKVRELIRKDEHMASATLDPAWVKPFGAGRAAANAELAQNESQSEPAEDPAAKAAAMLASLEPQDLGITLGGIMIGPRGRLATINGEACREGDVLSIALKNDKSTSLDFKILKITRQSVQLATSGKTFTLELGMPKLGAGDAFQTAKHK